MPILLPDLLAAGGRLYGSPGATTFADWSYDSRLTGPSECFVALRTARADGHDYIPAALAAGAAGLLCSWPPPDPVGATVILADDPRALLLRWAAARLAAVSPLVVAVTGSVGKTSTRRAVAAVLTAAGPTFQSRRSFNSLLGLPLALAHLEDGRRFAVLEFGSDRRGEIAALADAFPPQIGVVTNIGPVHLRAFGTLEAVAAEHSDLLAALPPTGVALLNLDDPALAVLVRQHKGRVIRYGQGQAAELRAEALRYEIDGTVVRFSHAGTTTDARIRLLGRPGVYAAAAAVAAGLACGLEVGTCAAALERLEPAAGRLRPLPACGGATLIDDSFSAPPPSLGAALETLAALPARRRFVLLGAPSELPPGTEAESLHKLGTAAAEMADALILKGDWGVAVAAAACAARPDLPVALVETAEAAVAALPANLGPGDLLLVKGGPAARMERVAARLLTGSGGGVETKSLASLHPAPSPLVRQEPAWRNVRVGDPGRPTWLRIDLDAIAGNVRALSEIAGVPLMAVLKADAYGHGAIRVARAALGAGARALAVATLGEARALRDQGMSAPILILGYTPPWQAAEAVRAGLDCTLFDDETARALSDAAAIQGRPARVQVKVDTGMHRLGLAPDEAGPFLRHLSDLPGIEVCGIYTHFAGADLPDLSSAQFQLDRFLTLLAELTSAGLRPPLAHAANSAATLRLPTARLDMVRPGIACYGLAPGLAAPLPPGFRPALSFHSEVAQVKEHPAGAPISYGGAYITPQPARIATIPVGYADGVRRAPPWRELLVRGRRAPVVGRINMDYLMVDVTEIAGVKRGDAVVLIGSQGDETISADEVAGWLGTISYEVLTGILPRVPREVEG